MDAAVHIGFGWRVGPCEAGEYSRERWRGWRISRSGFGNIRFGRGHKSVPFLAEFLRLKIIV